MTREKLKIGMFGYGCVGQGLHDVLNSSKGFKADIVKICVKDPNKKRRIPMSNFTFDKNDILNDPSINLVVELIDDPVAAFNIVTTAMKKGKNVVTANKVMLAKHFKQLVEMQDKYKVSLLYEASAGASIPIIRNLEEYYDNELLYSLRGILNGTTNYILTLMHNNAIDFNIALEEARAKGFAESDPTLDIEGWDAKYKLCIITGHAYGLFLDPEEVFHYGIKTISKFDIRYAREKGFKIKLVPFVGKTNENTITSFVLPRFISSDKYLYNVDYEYNGVITEAAFADKQFFSGKGAGGHATGSAVLSDISANSYGYRYEYKKYQQGTVSDYTRDYKLEVYLRYSKEKDRDLFKFEEISEFFSSASYKYVIGIINLQTLYALRKKIQGLDVFIVNTGRKGINT
ncbi:MAG TPA: homoserine dehydrogenase [Bacteroidales bacterium]|jgi:homoserine dehydrogenase|nr:homoserine dehydrogenase [Bacteroidales bacterium]OQB61352.1 MAG: Homoserine dehydrogenase [Bacteroidetes bacterium ADurb.Bin145]NMD04057.1 homoserine dehydrogenase [Bacteroidales bacterium]HOU01691.1 homoserine dehydrogenase [Bacteroidales bacterium]HQG63303.1 homoserine dehydrogenase [Bacteroidales bacterium]